MTLLDNQRITIDTTTGVGTLVGPLAAPIYPFGLAAVNNQLFTFDSTGVLYGLGQPDGILTSSTPRPAH